MWRERKKDIYKEEYIGECRFSIPRSNKPLSINKQNINLLSLKVAEKSITKLIAWRERRDNNYKKEQKDKADYLSHDTTCRCYSVYQI